MIFIALFKQIPDIGHVKIDQSTKRLIREGVPNILNPFLDDDLYSAGEVSRRRRGKGYCII